MDKHRSRRVTLRVLAACAVVAALSLSTTLRAAAATPSFSAHQDFSSGAGSGPASLAVTDVNGDGRPDLVVTDSLTSSVSVFLDTTAAGATTASIASHVDFATGTTPDGITVGDINGDGRPDIITADTGANTVSVLLNTTAAGATTPSFSAHQVFTAGNNPFAVTTADINGDGRPDVIVADTNSNTVSVLLNTTASGASTASLAAKVDFATAANPIAIGSIDVNGDGRSDIVTADNGVAAVSVLLNTTAAGALTPSLAAKTDFATGANPTGLALADLNGDGRPDLTTSNSPTDTVSVLLDTTASGATTASFAAKQDFGTGSGPQSVAAADMNGDGKPDLIVADSLAASVSVLSNTTPTAATAATFAAKQDFATAADPVSVAIADSDVNGDGRADITTADFTANSVSVLLNTTVPWPTSTVITASPNPQTAGQPVTVTATVSSTAGTPAGTVRFYDGGTQIGSATLDGSGVASFTTSSLSPGSHTLHASYDGDATFAASVSRTLVVTILVPVPQVGAAASGNAALGAVLAVAGLLLIGGALIRRRTGVASSRIR